MRGVTPRQQAVEAFAQLGVWDTDANNGVLIYVSWADRDVEIVADRGFNGRVTEQEWAAVCRRMEQSFARGVAAPGHRRGHPGGRRIDRAPFPDSRSQRAAKPPGVVGRLR